MLADSQSLLGEQEKKMFLPTAILEFCSYFICRSMTVCDLIRQLLRYFEPCVVKEFVLRSHITAIIRDVAMKYAWKIHQFWVSLLDYWYWSFLCGRKFEARKKSFSLSRSVNCRRRILFTETTLKVAMPILFWKHWKFYLMFLKVPKTILAAFKMKQN